MSIEQVKELRDRTNVSLNECRVALQEAGGDINEAIIVLQKKGVLRAGAAAGRQANQGQIFTYSHRGGIVGIVEVNCETDFAANSEPFQAFGDSLALQVVGVNPTYLRREDIPVDVTAQQMVLFAEASKTQGMPEDRLNKIVNGKMEKWFSEVCLMEQEVIALPAIFAEGKPKRTVADLRADVVMRIGENVVVRRFLRWQMGR